MLLILRIFVRETPRVGNCFLVARGRKHEMLHEALEQAVELGKNPDKILEIMGYKADRIATAPTRIKYDLVLVRNTARVPWNNEFTAPEKEAWLGRCEAMGLVEETGHEHVLERRRVAA